LNQIFVLTAPDHWCTPADHIKPETLNISLEDWKQKFLPIELGPDYQPRASQCSMFEVTENEIPKFLSGEFPGNQSENLKKIDCRNNGGWTYDQSEFLDTAVTDNNWVCDLATRVPDLYTYGCVGLILGTAIFSWLADAKGRKPAFYFSTVLMVAFQLIQVGVSHIYGAYLAMKILSFACMLPMFQTPMGIVTEISNAKARAYVIGLGCVAWSLGNCTLPLFGWAIARWKWIKVVCTVPAIIMYLTYFIVPESPRWLVSQGRMEDAKEVLTKIAKTNESKVPEDIEEKLNSVIEENNEKAYGYVSLFKNWQLTKRTICVTIAFTASAFVYYQLTLNIGNLGGNIFVTMFLMGLVEGPGCVGAVLLADKFGRRWTHFGMLATNAILFFIVMWIAYDPSLSNLVIFLCMWIKLNVSGTFVVSYLQAMELFPTNVRQSGIGFATLISQTISIGGPYTIYLGQYDLKLPYVIMFLICATGALAVALLPETLGARLPETLEEATEFGAKDKFFSFLPKREGKFNANLQIEKQEKEAMLDWNVKDVVDGEVPVAGKEKDIIKNHIQNAPESNV